MKSIKLQSAIKGNQGYSLIELMVSQTIILILITSLSSVQSKVLKSVSQQQKQLKTYFEMQEISDQLNLNTRLFRSYFDGFNKEDLERSSMIYIHEKTNLSKYNKTDLLSEYTIVNSVKGC